MRRALLMDLGKLYFTTTDSELPQAVRELSRETYEKYRNYGLILHEFDYYQRRLREIELNKESYFNTAEKYRNLYAQNELEGGVNGDFQREGLIDLNRCLINYISAFKSLVEHCEQRLMGEDGKESTKYKTFNEYASKIYDQHIEYKFMIRLRDYAVHVNFPIDSLTFDRIRIHQFKEKYSYETSVKFSKSILLENKKFGSKLAGDLKGYKDFFDVEPFVTGLWPLIRPLLTEFVRIEAPEFNSSAQEVLKLVEEAETDNIGLTIVSVDGGLIKHDTKRIPVQMAKDFLSFIKD